VYVSTYSIFPWLARFTTWRAPANSAAVVTDFFFLSPLSLLLLSFLSSSPRSLRDFLFSSSFLSSSTSSCQLSPCVLSLGIRPVSQCTSLSQSASSLAAVHRSAHLSRLQDRSIRRGKTREDNIEASAAREYGLANLGDRVVILHRIVGRSRKGERYRDTETSYVVRTRQW